MIVPLTFSDSICFFGRSTKSSLFCRQILWLARQYVLRSQLFTSIGHFCGWALKINYIHFQIGPILDFMNFIWSWSSLATNNCSIANCTFYFFCNQKELFPCFRCSFNSHQNLQDGPFLWLWRGIVLKRCSFRRFSYEKVAFYTLS